VRDLQRLDDLRLGHALGAGLDHHQPLAAAGHDDVQACPRALGVGRIEEELLVHQCDAHRADRPLEGNLGERDSCRGPVDGEHVGIVVRVGREDEGDDLRLMVPAGGEERAHRPVDHPAGEHFLLARLPLALEEPARDPARGVRVLAVVHRQRQEVDPLPLGGRVARGDQDDRVAEPDHDRAVGLLGQLARLEGQDPAPDGEFTLVHRSCLAGTSRLAREPRAGKSDPGRNARRKPDRNGCRGMNRNSSRSDAPRRGSTGRSALREAATSGCRDGGSNRRTGRYPSA